MGQIIGRAYLSRPFCVSRPFLGGTFSPVVLWSPAPLVPWSPGPVVPWSFVHSVLQQANHVGGGESAKEVGGNMSNICTKTNSGTIPNIRTIVSMLTLIPVLVSITIIVHMNIGGNSNTCVSSNASMNIINIRVPVLVGVRFLRLSAA